MKPDYPMYLHECDAKALSLFATAGSRLEVPLFSDIEARICRWLGPDTKFPSFDTLTPSGGLKRGELIAFGPHIGGRSFKSDIFSTYRIKLAEQRWKRYELDLYNYMNNVVVPVKALEAKGWAVAKCTRVRAWSQEVFNNEFSSMALGRSVLPYVEDYSEWPTGSVVEFKGHWEQRHSSAIVPDNWHPDPKLLRAQLKAMRSPISHSFYTGRTGRVDP